MGLCYALCKIRIQNDAKGVYNRAVQILGKRIQMFLCLLNWVIDYLMLKSKEGTCEICEVLSHGS